MIKPETLELRLKEDEVFEPKTREINFEVQELFHFTRTNVNEVIRDFYESLTRAIFSGTLRERQNETSAVEPDLTDVLRSRYIEVKAAGHTRKIMLKDGQISKYSKLQTSDYPIQNPRIYWTLFRYGVRGIQNKYGHKPTDEIIDYLSQDTRFMVGLPFSVIYELHEEGFGENGLATRFNGKIGTPCTNFSTVMFDLFFSKPEQALEMFGLNPEDFRIRRHRVPEDILMNSHPLKPFPLVLIKDNDQHHACWIERLKRKQKEEVPF